MRPLGRAWALAERHKMVVGVIPTVALLVLAWSLPADQVQLYGLLASLPAVVLFIIAYIPERPDRFWFGSSLLLRSFAVLSVVLAAALVRIVGPGFRMQQVLVTMFIGLTFSSMTIGTIYLVNDQGRHHRGVGGWLRCTIMHQCDDEAQHQ